MTVTVTPVLVLQFALQNVRKSCKLIGELPPWKKDSCTVHSLEQNA